MALKDENNKHNIVVTGFGLFRDHGINPSWEAIRDGRLKINRPEINIVTERVEVAYEAVDCLVPELWKKHDPILVVHVGLAAIDDLIRLERIARCGPYSKDDVRKTCPHKHLKRLSEVGSECEDTPDEDDTMQDFKQTCKATSLDIEQVCDRLNEAHSKKLIPMGARVSEDAGLYVCEYIYKTSLNISDRCVFIHVPDTKNCTIEDITKALELAIESLVDQVLSQQIG